MTWRSKHIRLCIALLVVAVATSALYLHRVATSRAQISETSALGLLLVIYVEDVGHFPADLYELHRSQYLTYASNGLTAIGPAARNRGFIAADEYYLYHIDTIAAYYHLAPRRDAWYLPRNEVASSWAQGYLNLINSKIAMSSSSKCNKGVKRGVRGSDPLSDP
jgi:hypothetical protein